MTNREAIEILKGIQKDIMPNDELSGQRTEDIAFDLAIKALEEKEERSKHPSELHRIVAHKEEADRAADALDKHIAEWEAKYGSKI